MILFHHEGGIDVGDVDAKALSLLVATGKPFPSQDDVKATLLKHVNGEAKKDTLAEFIARLYHVYADLHFTYLEINPLVVLDSPNPNEPPQICYLDLAGKLDQTAEFEAGAKWSEALNSVKTIAKSQEYLTQIDFPAPFGRLLSKEEAYVAELDAKTGASLKLTILNENGRIWTMVAGGGASVVYRYVQGS
jgi:ATP citrate (pro-S)-lyase